MGRAGVHRKSPCFQSAGVGKRFNTVMSSYQKNKDFERILSYKQQVKRITHSDICMRTFKCARSCSTRLCNGATLKTLKKAILGRRYSSSQLSSTNLLLCTLRGKC